MIISQLPAKQELYFVRIEICSEQNELNVHKTMIRSSQEHTDRIRVVLYFLGTPNWKFLHVLK